MVQLHSLQAGLDASLEDRAQPPRQPGAFSSEGQDDLASEIFRRHGHSAQPHSQQLCAILSAVLEVLRAEGLQPSPTALYAALMSSLEKPETLNNSEVGQGGEGLAPHSRHLASLACLLARSQPSTTNQRANARTCSR